MNTKRELYLDSFKFIAILNVIFSHFFSYCRSHYKINLNSFSFVNGKYGVIIFCIVLGLLAYKQGQKGKNNIIVYSLKRYIYFVICGFIINTVYYAINYNDIRCEANYNYVIGESLFLSYQIYPTYWFAKDFCIGSIICYILGEYDVYI